MRIIRGREEAEFTVLPNALISDGALSYAALGLLVWLLHLPPGYEIGGIKDLARRKRGGLRHEGRDVLATCLRELQQAGYMTLTRLQDPETGRWETVREVRSRPQAPPAAAPPPEKPQVTPGPGNPGPGNPGPGEPGSGNPGRFNKYVEQELTPPPHPGRPPQRGTGHNQQEEAEEAAAAPTTDQPAQAHAARLVATAPWPPGRAPNAAATARLTRSATACLQRGHPPAEVSRTMTADLDSARSPAAVALSRLRELANQPPTAATPRGTHNRPPWCGRCEPSTRQVAFDDDRPARCPACHPLAGTHHAAAGGSKAGAPKPSNLTLHGA